MTAATAPKPRPAVVRTLEALDFWEVEGAAAAEPEAALGAAEAEAAGGALLKLRAGAVEGMMLLVAADADALTAALSTCPTPHGMSFPFNFEPSGCAALAGAV